MQTEILKLPEIKLVGITAKTRTSNIAETDPRTAQIIPTIQHYFSGGFGEKIPLRKKPDVTYCVYTGYESDFTGAYTYFIGEEAQSFGGIPEDLVTLLIPAQTYVKFVVGPGVMPKICLETWQKIWEMTSNELGGERRYSADFEVYDERALDPQNTTLDIFIGVKD